MNRRNFLPASKTAFNSLLPATAQTHLAHAGASSCHLEPPDEKHWVLNIDKRTTELIEDKESDNENF